MKKLGLLVILCSSFAFGQVKGDLATDGRAITTDIEYEMTLSSSKDCETYLVCVTYEEGGRVVVHDEHRWGFVPCL